MTASMLRAQRALDIEVVLDSPNWSRSVRGARAWCDQVARATIAAARPAKGKRAFCIALSSDRRVKALNRIFRGIDKPTNVLSFAAASGAKPPRAGTQHLGDVVIAFETMRREAVKERKSLRAHLAHLVVHGVLHLLGLDHETDRDAEKMESIERKALAGLGIADPYADNHTGPKPRAAKQARRRQRR
ncbi:MAG: rRNA maturation RNase YbeY [Rhodobacteraceae bacterium]|nr:rRNA maturation RNase YbeY [Paracoccaceae bacterium]